MLVITGASGFVGQNMLGYLKARDIDFIPISRSYGNNYEEINSIWLDEHNIIGVIHLAGIAHDTKALIKDSKYYAVNTNLTCKLFDAFLNSKASLFVYMSSVKALTDISENPLSEEFLPEPSTVYGKSKLSAENYLLKQSSITNKRVIILRPAMVYGPGNKGNLNLLYQIVAKGMPWPLGAYENLRSFCSVENLCFVVNEIIQNPSIASGIYHIADDEPISTNDLICIIAEVLKRKPHIWKVSKRLVNLVAKVGDRIKLPINTERLHKLTSSYMVSNKKIAAAIGKPMPVSVREGLFKTLSSFNKL